MQVITHVEVTPSSGSDAGVTVGVIRHVEKRGIGPSVVRMVPDTTDGTAERRGTELGPRAGRQAGEDDGLVRLTALTLTSRCKEGCGVSGT